MAGPVLLNNVDHHDLCVTLARGAPWGDAVNRVTVFPTEIEALSRDYAIVLRRGADATLETQILLGFERDENLFVDDGRWDARTIPALMQRGPFSIGVPPAGEAGEPMIHIDPADPRVGTHTGERIFLEHGGNTAYLDHMGGVLRSIYAGSQIMPAMIAAFGDAGLLEEATLELEHPSGRRFVIPDVVLVSADRFARLDGDTMARLHAGDFLRCAVWILSSLGNLPALLDRKVAYDGRR